MGWGGPLVIIIIIYNLFIFVVLYLCLIGEMCCSSTIKYPYGQYTCLHVGIIMHIPEKFQKNTVYCICWLKASTNHESINLGKWSVKVYGKAGKSGQTIVHKIRF